MAYLDAGSGSMILIALVAGIFGLVGWVLNIVAAVAAGKIGRPARWRLIFHIIGFFFYPLGGILGLVWLFKWRESDKLNSERSSYPPPPPPNPSIS